MRDRSVSPTFASNELFYGDSSVAADERFSTSQKQSSQQTANTFQIVEGQSPLYAKGMKPRKLTMNGVLGEYSERPATTPNKSFLQEKATRINSKTRDRVRVLNECNQQIKSQKTREQTLQTFQDKNNLCNLGREQEKNDERAASTIKIYQNRHTQHLKRDKVSANTYQMQTHQSASRLSLQDSNHHRVSIVETFTGDPMFQVFQSRSLKSPDKDRSNQ